MKPARNLPIPAVVALAALFAGGIGIWRGLSQPPVEVAAPKSPLEEPLAPPKLAAPPEAAPSAVGLAGVVLMPDGTPAAGAVVHGQPSAFVGKPTLQAVAVPKDAQIVADAQGHFSLDVSLDWSWNLRAQKDALAGVKVDAMPPDAKVVIQLSGSQTVRVTVREKNGQGVGQVPVGLSAQGQSAPAFEGLSDGAGHVDFERVPLGRWHADAVENVVGKAPNGRPMSRERRRAGVMFELQASAPAEVVLELGSVGKIRGRVTAPAGTDLSQLVVFSVPAPMAKAMQAQEYGAQLKEMPGSYPSAKVGADGRFELNDVSGPQGLIVPHPKLMHGLVTAEPDGAEALVALFKDKTVKGRVVDGAGKPVTVFSVNGAPYESAEGAFEYRPGGGVGAERPKHLPLIVTANGFQPLEKQLELGPGDTDVGVITLQPGRSFILKVVEEKGGAPVDDVTFVRLDGTALSTEPVERLAPGTYHFSRLPAADTTLALTRFGGATRKVPVGATETERTYRFGDGATLKGVVLGPNGKPAIGARVFPSGDMRATRLTDEAGKYLFPGLEAGPLTLVVMFGRSTAIKKATVPESGEVELNVELPAEP